MRFYNGVELLEAVHSFSSSCFSRSISSSVVFISRVAMPSAMAPMMDLICRVDGGKPLFGFTTLFKTTADAPPGLAAHYRTTAITYSRDKFYPARITHNHVQIRTNTYKNHTKVNLSTISNMVRLCLPYV